jgi:hypothetical protein
LKAFAWFAASFANFVVQGSCDWAGKQKLLTAECAKKGREVREEIQTAHYSRLVPVDAS